MILLIDGNNLAHRVFHTNSGLLTTKDGEPSGVIRGTLGSIRGMLEKFPEVTKVIVVWDGGKADWRKEVYPEYKAQRDYGKDDPEKAERYAGLWSQIDTLNENLHKFGVNSIKVGGWEADDIIALIARKAEIHTMVVTSDKDMLQLISDNVSVYSPYKDRVITPLNFEDETGVEFNAYIGYRALLGDPSDNIIGIPGIGEKTAQTLMKKWGHIDNILQSQGKDRDTLMKSKRTARIFEEENLQRLGINNKIMNFDYVPTDNESVNSAVDRSLSSDPELKSKEIKDFFIKWQFLTYLTEYMTWVTPFLGLGED